MMKLFLLFSFVTFFFLSPIDNQDHPHFGTGIVLLNPPESGLFFEGQMSPDGQFVVGTAISDMNIQAETHLHLWDLRGIERNGHGIEAEIMASFDMSPYVGSIFDRGHIAFSLDSQNLAVFSPHNILLLSIPDLDLLETIPIERQDNFQNWGNIAWSADGGLLAVNHIAGLVVWDGSGVYAAAHEPGVSKELFYFGDGWIIDYESGFTFCTALLESCKNVDFENPFDDVILAGQMLITDSQKLPIMAWTQDADGAFRANPAPYSNIQGSLSSVSLDGRYHFMTRWTEGCNPDYPYYILYEGETELYELESHHQPVWLGASGYFVQGNDLFHPGDARAIDHINSFHIEGIEDDSELGMWPEYLGGESVSADGRWYMKLLGATALVVPVIFDT